jgi:four helix bundle protein
VLGQFLGDGFSELGAEMPEKGMAPRTEQAHEAVTDQDKAEKLQESLLHKVRSKKEEGRSVSNYRPIIQNSQMAPRNQDLQNRTKNFALRVIRMFAALPKRTEAQILGKQVLRSGTSIGANYREAHRGRSKPEFIAKCGDCLREAEETGYWLELLVEAGVLSADKIGPLRQETTELIAIFVTIVKRSKE